MWLVFTLVVLCVNFSSPAMWLMVAFKWDLVYRITPPFLLGLCDDQSHLCGISVFQDPCLCFFVKISVILITSGLCS